jgi:hypothetical protein
VLRWSRRCLLGLGVLLAGPLLMASCGSVKLNQDWRTADRSSTGQVAPARATPEAVIQVYAARAFNWRGIFAVHTWIATKAAGADAYTVHQVLGWNARHGGRVVVSNRDLPDRRWYGADPTLLFELRGAEAEAAIPKIDAAIARYPYPHRYVLWPGPNSNTFVAHVARQVPELSVDLPPTAIGKDFLPGGALVARAPSGTGVQLSVFGLAGLILALEEGVELNVLSLGIGVDPGGPALRLPGLGHLGRH